MKYTIIAFDPINDDNKILVGNSWGTVKDQEMWTEIVKENTTSDGNIDPLWSSIPMTGVREIWGPNNQFYGYVIHYEVDQYFAGPLGVWVVDDNTVWLIWH